MNTNFSHVKGCDEVKEELKEIIDYLQDPSKFTRLGAKLPKGIMMAGPPGTGKTLLARAIAGEAKVPFIQASGSEFEEMFVGVGARRIRDLFAAARKHTPCIVFIDEVDAVGSKRNNKDNSAVRMTLNQLLTELDGFEQNEGLVVICATNFAESLDKALTRPGRLDKTIVVPLPDLAGRKEILEMYADKISIGDDVDIGVLAKRCGGMSGADLFNVVNIAAVRASSEGKDAVHMSYLEEAFDRVIVGLQRKNPMSERERRATAYHESGHALVAFHSKGAEPVHKATIMPRGQALGVTWQVPAEEKYSERVFELEARLYVLMGGKAAESLIYGPENVSAGCSNDLSQATNLCRRMVMNFGMGMTSHSEAPMYLDTDQYAILSDDIKTKVDHAVQKLMSDSYDRAYDILKTNRGQLDGMAEGLLRFETLGHEELKLAMDNKLNKIEQNRDAAKKKQADQRKQKMSAKQLAEAVSQETNGQGV